TSPPPTSRGRSWPCSPTDARSRGRWWPCRPSGAPRWPAWSAPCSWTRPESGCMLDLTPDRLAAPATGPLAPGVTIQVAGAQVSAGPGLERLLLQGDPDAFGDLCALPSSVGTVAEHGELAALCLGPTEWLLLAPPGSPALTRLRQFDGPGGAAVD